MNSYARDLLTVVTTDLRDAKTALPFAHEAVEKSEDMDPLILDTLALAQKMTGDIDGAVKTQIRAVALLPSGVSTVRNDLDQRLAKYLIEQKSFAKAEPMLLEANRRFGASSDSTTGEPRRQVARLLVDLYTAWDAADPGKGYGVKAAKWRAKLPKEKAAEATSP